MTLEDGQILVVSRFILLRQKGLSFLCGDLERKRGLKLKWWKVRRGSHEEEHREGEPAVEPGYAHDKPAILTDLWWDRCVRRSGLSRHSDNGLLVWPDNEPNI